MKEVQKLQFESVVLVDSNDQHLGVMEKMEAHEKGVLHRAFSVFVFNSEGKMLIQKRADGKYHSPGLWTNTVCSHPHMGEKTSDAAHRRLMEEMGVECEIEEVFSFIYKADVGDGLTEHEFDHVFTATSDAIPVPNPAEVSEYKYVEPEWLKKDVEDNPGMYTIWFKIALKEVNEQLLTIQAEVKKNEK